MAWWMAISVFGWSTTLVKFEISQQLSDGLAWHLVQISKMPWRMHNNNSGDALTFHLAPPAGQCYILGDISDHLLDRLVQHFLQTFILISLRQRHRSMMIVFVSSEQVLSDLSESTASSTVSTPNNGGEQVAANDVENPWPDGSMTFDDPHSLCQSYPARLFITQPIKLFKPVQQLHARNVFH